MNSVIYVCVVRISLLLLFVSLLLNIVVVGNFNDQTKMVESIKLKIIHLLFILKISQFNQCVKLNAKFSSQLLAHASPKQYTTVIICKNENKLRLLKRKGNNLLKFTPFIPRVLSRRSILRIQFCTRIISRALRHRKMACDRFLSIIIVA